MDPMLLEWLKRVVGYATTLCSALVARKVTQVLGQDLGLQLGDLVGGLVATLGGVLLHKAQPTMLPSRPQPQVVVAPVPAGGQPVIDPTDRPSP